MDGLSRALWPMEAGCVQHNHKKKRDAVERFHLAALCVWINVVQVNSQPSAAHGH